MDFCFITEVVGEHSMGVEGVLSDMLERIEKQM
jgi:hypothetical protein